MFKRYPLLTSLLLCGLFTQAQITWEPLNGPKGISLVEVIACDAGGRLFAHHYSGKLYISDDDGTTWKDGSPGILPGDLPNLTKILAAPSGKIYAFSNNKVYVSNAASQEWILDPNSQLNTSAVFDDVGRMWKLNAQGEAFMSSDDGQTFKKVLGETKINNPVKILAPHNNKHNLIARGNRLYHFTITGAIKEVAVASMNIQYVGYNPASGVAFFSTLEGLYRSADSGLSWKKIIMTPDELYPHSIYKMFFGPSGRIWTTDNIQIYQSDDDGITWKTSSTGYFLFRSPNGYLFKSNLCLKENFQRSKDQGQTWTDISRAFSQPIVRDIIQSRQGNLFVEGFYYYNRSTDGGLTWEYDITVSDSTHEKITQLVAHPDGPVFAIAKGLYVSADGSGPWTPLELPKPVQDGLHSIDIDYQGVLYAFPYKSLDKGKSWSVVNTDSIKFQSLGLSNFESHTTISGEVYTFNSPGKYGNIYHLNTSGQFEEVPFFKNLLPWLITSNNYGITFVTSHDSIYQSDNGGTDWTFAGKIPPNIPYQLGRVLYVGADQHLYLGYEGDVVYRSAETTATRKLIVGHVWLDRNDDCIHDPDESGYPICKIQATGSNGEFSGVSGANGRYRLSVPDGSYTLNAVSPSPFFEPCLPDVPVTLTSSNDTAFVNLILQETVKCPYMRVIVAPPQSLRRCKENQYTIQYCNGGTATATGAYVEIQLDSMLDFVSASLPVSAQNGRTYTFLLGDVPKSGCGLFSIKVMVSCAAAWGQEHCVQAHIYPDQPCLPALPVLSLAKGCKKSYNLTDTDERASTHESKWMVSIPIDTVELHQPYHINAYPNPFETAVTFKFKGPELPDQWDLRIYDALGRLVEYYHCSGRTFTAPRGNMNSGFYHCVISSDTGQRLWSGTLLAGDL